MHGKCLFLLHCLYLSFASKFLTFMFFQLATVSCVNPWQPKSDLSIWFCLTPDNFYSSSSKGDLLGLKGLSLFVITYLFCWALSEICLSRCTDRKKVYHRVSLSQLSWTFSITDLVRLVEIHANSLTMTVVNNKLITRHVFTHVVSICYYAQFHQSQCPCSVGVRF